MASHRAPKVSGRATAIGLVGVAAGAVALLPAASQAAPTQSIDQVKAEVNQLNQQAEVAGQAYDAAQEQYAKLQQKVDGLQAQITQEQTALTTLESSMGLQAAAQYRSGGISPTLQLAISSSPDKYLAHVKIADRRGRILIDWLRNGVGASAGLDGLTQLARAETQDGQHHGHQQPSTKPARQEHPHQRAP